MKKLQLILLCLLFAPPSNGAVITVDPNGFADHTIIQDAIDAAVTGDTVLVAPALYYEHLEIIGKTITLASHYTLSNNLQDILNTIVDGSGVDAVLTVTNVGPETTVTGFTFRNGNDGLAAYSKFNLLYNRFVGCADGADYEGGGGVCMFNYFEDNRDDGIDLDGGAEIVIAYNIIRENNDDGIEIRLHAYSGPLLTCIIKNNIISGSGEDAIQFIDYPDISDREYYIQNNIIENTAMAAIGCMSNGNTIEDYQGASIPEPIYTINNTFFGNNYGICGGDNMIVKNNIFAATNQSAIRRVDGTSLISYNAFWQNTIDLEESLSAGGDIFNVDPYFVSPGQNQQGEWIEGDYHLRSQAGRWDPNLLHWEFDALSSICIDAGDPNSILADELWPHGKRINIGTYGGTAQASKSLAMIGNIADLNNDDSVSYNDFARLAGKWLMTGDLMPEDIDRDGKVDIRDLKAFAEQWFWGQ